MCGSHGDYLGENDLKKKYAISVGKHINNMYTYMCQCRQMYMLLKFSDL